MRQKRGMVALEEVVKLIPVILLVFLVMALFSRQLDDLGDQSTTIEGKDIATLARDFALVQPEGALTLPSKTLYAGRTEECTAPDQQDCYRPVSLTIYPALESPSPCKGKPCICGSNALNNELILCSPLAASACPEKPLKECNKQACVREKKTIRLVLQAETTNKIVLSRQCTGDLGLVIMPAQTSSPQTGLV